MNNFYKTTEACHLRASFSGGIVARLFVLCVLLIFSAFCVSAQTNTLADGTYYIRKPGTNLFLGRGTSGGTLTFKTIESDKSLQRFNITKETNGRYKILIENPGTMASHVNENGVLPISTNTFDLRWHTFNIYYSGANNLYAIQTAESAGTIFFAINSSTNVLSGKNGIGLKTADPVSYQLELVP